MTYSLRNAPATAANAVHKISLRRNDKLRTLLSAPFAFYSFPHPLMSLPVIPQLTI